MEMRQANVLHRNAWDDEQRITEAALPTVHAPLRTRRSYLSPEEPKHSNVRGTLNGLEVTKHSGMKWRDHNTQENDGPL